MQPCPIDCVVGEWSEYGMCSAPCGGGIMSRVRQPLTDAEHGGEPCGANLKGSNHPNYSDQSSVKILSELRRFC